MTSENATRWLTPDIGLIDLYFQDTPHVIGAYLLPTDDGLALIECGPSTTLGALEAGVQALGHDLADVRHLLVTHIHLDHAGAAGVLLDRLPNARLYVHEIGAPHMVDPANLVRSATRIYTDRMDLLWGEIRPVDANRLQVVADNDVLTLGGRSLTALYTPGHASHHLAFHDATNNFVFSGDVAGVRIPPATEVWPPTPPPDITIEGWHTSIDRLREVAPDQLLLTHFGPWSDVASHLDQLKARLDEWVVLVEGWVKDGLDRDALIAKLADTVHTEMVQHGSENLEAMFELTTPHWMSIDGLVRYLRKSGRISSD
ncbi:MAG: MBL fold metallo-hydrolase [Thermomicrobiales bacterium]|nr:MBL fold metallo-hydrolase [Thermomicrobiales bacterium]